MIHFLRKRLALSLVFLGLTCILTSPQAFGLITPNYFSDNVRKLNLNVADKKWDFFDAEDTSSKTSQTDLELQFVARAPKVNENKTQPTLTWRVDKGEWDSAKKYSSKWLKEFPKFGYELQTSGDAKYGALNGFDMELLSTISDRRIRQFVVARAKEMWVFTCSADTKHFNEAWDACRKILNTSKFQK
ncbi:MAG: hypothetical protein SGI74_09715 [Oligoflexia bacterium]|nr:hypothetical protein [Oligoflexia bacterium]